MIANAKMMIKENSKYIILTFLLLLIGCPITAYGMSSILPFWKAYALLSTTILPALVYLKAKSDQDDNLSSLFEKELSIAETQLNDSWKELDELKEVLEEYESIFDGQQWEIPCNCGENTFIGLFSPYAENICSCEKCKNHYKITLNYESILVTEPLNNDQIFDSLKTRLESDPSSLKEIS